MSGGHVRYFLVWRTPELAVMVIKQLKTINIHRFSPGGAAGFVE
jgi:hypothetical protein